ncbi:MAG: M28 family peptidase [Candidatus Omnitrophota bacterium]|nr:MAG: M28 family peptidase [Candidatus Omnitrophota bacterium]
MRKMLHFAVFILVAFIIVKLSAFGWRFSAGFSLVSSEQNKELSEKLKFHVHTLAHEIGDRSMFKYEKLLAAEKYIAKDLASFGYEVEFHEYTISDKVARNIIAYKQGTQKPDEIIIVGAHYDSCFNPGANDNASGIAVLLELARCISDSQISRTIKFIAFVNEEPPFFKTEKMGSRVYARDAKAKGENIKGVVILETIGYYSNKLYSQRYPPFFGPFYPNRGNFICVASDFHSRNLLKGLVSNFKKGTQFPIESITTFGFVPGVDFSDHWSFWQEGYPAVMITDTSFYRSSNYHGRSDTYEKLNYGSMAEITRGLCVAVGELIQ